MNEQEQEVHDTSLAWLTASVFSLRGLDDLTHSLAAQFWAAVAQEAACASAIMVRAATNEGDGPGHRANV